MEDFECIVAHSKTGGWDRLVGGERVSPGKMAQGLSPCRHYSQMGSGTS